MSTIRFPFGILLALVVLALAQFIYFSPQLPETVASHFDALGAPNRWMSKTAFLIIMLLATILAAGTTAGLAILFPRFQDSMNIPNKEHWLAPARRDQTMAVCSSAMLWIACTVLALFLVLRYCTFRLNIENEKSFGLPMIPTLVAFFVVIGTIVTRMILKFRNTQSDLHVN